jgi:hypothetical protein
MKSFSQLFQKCFVSHTTGSFREFHLEKKYTKNNNTQAEFVCSRALLFIDCVF